MQKSGGVYHWPVAYTPQRQQHKEQKHQVKKYSTGGSTNTADQGAPRWFNYILIATFSIAAFAMLIMIAAALIVPPAIQSVVEKYTSDQPMNIVQEPLPQFAQDALDDRVESFAEAIEDGQTPEPLILSSRDLNSLLQKLWKDEELSGQMTLRIEDGRIRSDLSIPLESGFSIGPFTPDVAGRYMNGTVTFRVSLNGRTLSVDIERFVVNGKELPGWIVEALEREYLHETLLNSPDVREFTDKLARLEVSADSIMLEAAVQ